MAKCRHCGKKNLEHPYQMGISLFCNKDHAVDWMLSNRDKAKKVVKSINRKKEKEQKAKDKEKLKELTPRSTWFAKWLQPLVNQYNRDVLYAGKPCYTCGKPRGTEQTDWGHFIAVGSGGGDRRRFMPENGRPQCSHCNNHKSGMRAEFRENLILEKGLEWVQWLECESNHPSLKEQFPTWQDIENEIKRYRQLIREAGLKPCR